MRSRYPFGTIDVVSEGKESVRADDHRAQGADPALLFSSRQKLRHLIKHGLPNRQIWTLPTEEKNHFVHRQVVANIIPVDRALIHQMPPGVWCEPSHPFGPPYLSNGVAHILVNSIGHLCSLHTSTELHVQDTGVVSQPPVISFVASQSGTVDARLLASTDANNLQSHTSATMQRCLAPETG